MGIFLFCFASCGEVRLDSKLAICGAYSVPGMFCSDLKGDAISCNIIEEDPEGRVLFEYASTSIVTGLRESALVICQHSDDEYVYFYEDICYCLDDKDQLTIEVLKEENDWGQPLDYSKMSRRKVKVSFDLFILTDSELEYTKLLDVSSKAIKIDNSQIEALCFVDHDSAGHVLYYLIPDLSVTTHTYLVLFDSRYNASVLEVMDKKIDQAAIALFKRENGWIYGFKYES